MNINRSRKQSYTKHITSWIIILLLTTLLTPPPLLPPAHSQSATPLMLVVTSAPRAVTADGGEYPILVIQIQNRTGFPVPASSDIQVVLSASKLEVGDVEQSVTIPKGATYTVAKFKTTKTPGTVNVTAAATGFTIGSSKVTTIDPSISPKKLVVELGPKQVLPELGANGTIVVQLQDANGIPARAPDSIIVSLSSSLLPIATVDPTLMIDAGRSYGRAYFYTTFTPGITTITASTSGYVTGSEVLTVKGPTPFKLAVYAAPSEITERGGVNTTIVVQLQDSNGTPVIAPVDVPVTVTPSNTTVGYVSKSSITIESGKTYANTSFIGLLGGSAKITATAQKYVAGLTTVTVARRGLADRGNLAIYLAPPTLLPDNRFHSAIYVQLKDSAGRIVASSRAVNIHLTSSNTEIGFVESPITIPPGSTYGIARFHSTHAAGVTTITASAADFSTTTATMKVTGAAPDQIKVSVVPKYLSPDGTSHKSLVIQLQDHNDEPVNAPSNVVITLSSSKTNIGTVDERVVLPAGTSTLTATFHSTLVAGTTTVTASASGFVSGSVDVVTVEPAPSLLTVTTAPSIVPADGGVYQPIVIQLQDSTGVPAKARHDITISLSSSNEDIGEVDRRVVLREGETFVKAAIRTSGKSGTTTITALASDYVGSSTKLTTILQPLTLTLTPKEVRLNVTDTATLNLSVKSDGAPVPGATVSWSTTIGNLPEASKVTNSSGSASATFRHYEAGTANVTATVSKIGYRTASTTVRIRVQPLNLVVASIPSLNIKTAEPILINVTVLSGGKPVQNATLSWKATKGTLGRASERTSAGGGGTAVFFSNEGGTAKINVTASKQGYLPALTTITVDIKAEAAATNTTTTPDQTATTSPQELTVAGLNLYMTLGLAAVLIVVILAAVLILRRRRRAPPKLGEGETVGIVEG